jgi:hypothetical protein
MCAVHSDLRTQTCYAEIREKRLYIKPASSELFLTINPAFQRINIKYNKTAFKSVTTHFAMTQAILIVIIYTSWRIQKLYTHTYI